MKIYAPLLLVALCPAMLSSAVAETSISTLPPLAKSTTTKTPAHKAKSVVHATKPLPTSVEQTNAAAPKTIPMDFSGMARRPVDLKPESYSSPRPDTGEHATPGLGVNSNGGLSPGMKIGF
jgi:hypothetical protein